MADDTPQVPTDFTLEGEASRAKDAALGGIVAREDVVEVDPAAPVNGVHGSADGDDDVAVEDADREPIPDTV